MKKAIFYYKNKEDLIAIVIKSNIDRNETEFLTPNSFFQQVGFIVRRKGDIIKAHYHNRLERKITLTQETLFIKKGKLRVRLYSKEGIKIKNIILNQGDVIFLAGGGHGFDVMENTEIIEVKQGPYIAEKDKTYY